MRVDVLVARNIKHGSCRRQPRRPYYTTVIGLSAAGHRCRASSYSVGAREDAALATEEPGQCRNLGALL